ncbi:MAG: hypothetical protein KAU21_14365 [Gammaproteobacteria bacterium]|nr:hypothetical protein [Gammaproteobacteria bacterium]
MSKGSKQRQSQVPRKEFDDNWERIFGKKNGILTRETVNKAIDKCVKPTKGGNVPEFISVFPYYRYPDL